MTGELQPGDMLLSMDGESCAEMVIAVENASELSIPPAERCYVLTIMHLFGGRVYKKFIYRRTVEASNRFFCVVRCES
jgi:hypothetical protein